MKGPRRHEAACPGSAGILPATGPKARGVHAGKRPALPGRRPKRTFTAKEIFELIEGWHHPHRRHQRLGLSVAHGRSRAPTGTLHDAEAINRPENRDNISRQVNGTTDTPIPI